MRSACCLYLGGLVGALRALAPVKGRGAFLPDVAQMGMLLLFLQSYAAGYSDAGSLRWYMLAAGFLGAAAAHSLLGPLAARLWRMLLGRGGLWPAGRPKTWFRPPFWPCGSAGKGAAPPKPQKLHWKIKKELAKHAASVV